MHELWIRLFQRTAAKRNLRSFPNALPVYFLIIVGKKRTRLTVQHLRCLQEGGGDEEVISEATEMETASGFSFYTCLSNFRDERTGAETDVTVPLLELRHRFVHYISHSNLQRLATESLEKMHKHFSQGHAWNDQDTMGKFLCPGLGWEVRPDEIGSNLVTAKDLSHMTGYWKNDQNFSDDPGILVDVMEMPWFFKKASKLLNYTQVPLTEPTPQLIEICRSVLMRSILDSTPKCLDSHFQQCHTTRVKVGSLRDGICEKDSHVFRLF